MGRFPNCATGVAVVRARDLPEVATGFGTPPVSVSFRVLHQTLSASSPG